MNELTWEEVQASKGGDVIRKLEMQEYLIPSGHKGVSVDVRDGKDYVILTVDGNSVSMTIDGARDLALALRQSANRMEKMRRSRM